MKILITGASGLLGSNLCFIAAQKGLEVVGLYNAHEVKIKGVKTVKADLSQANFFSSLNFKPDVIIHCAALTNVDLCEEDKTLAEKMNITATENVLDFAKSSNAKFIFISTDSIFDGKTPFHKESEKPHPINYYAQTKVDAEAIVKKYLNHVIVRTNMYGFNIQNSKTKLSFSEWLTNKFENKEKITAFTDFHFSPLVVNNLCEALLELAQNDFTGTINVAGEGRISKYEFALMFAKEFGFDESLVIPTKMSELENLRAERPKENSLDISLAKKTLKTVLLDIPDGIKLYKKLMEEKYPERLRENK
ncbi:MAG: SDR family oxidoreductase [Candidatus Micrarchaeota archaeon]